MIIPGLEDEFSSEQLDRYNHGRFEEMVQMLSDLGYLSIAEVEGEIVADTELRKGIKLFRYEALREGLLPASEFLNARFGKLKPADYLTSRELNLLQLLTGLDGGFVLKQLPEQDHISISSRVFHYRMNLLGLYDWPVDQAFSVSGVSAWKQLKQWFCDVDEQQLLYLSGDFNDLIYRVRTCESIKNRLIYFRYQSPKFNPEHFSIHEVNGFYHQLRLNVDRKSVEFKVFKRKVYAGQPDVRYLEGECDNPLNRFLIRLVQLSQWISGYYLGAIDGNFGELSFESLLNIVNAEVESGNVNFQSQKFIASVDGDYWAVNIHYLLDGLQEPSAFSLNHESFFTEYQNALDQFSETEQNQFAKNMNSSWESMNRLMSANFKSKSYRFRRIYFGAKNRIRSMMRHLGAFLKKIAQSILSALPHLVNKLKNLSKMLFMEIREGLQHFSRGMQFLFCKRTFNSPGISTRFDLDCDTLVFVHQSPDEGVIRDHMFSVNASLQSLSLSLYITGRIINFILSLATANYPMVLVKLGGLFKQELVHRQLKMIR
jgi:hypothetical protein